MSDANSESDPNAGRYFAPSYFGGIGGTLESAVLATAPAVPGLGLGNYFTPGFFGGTGIAFRDTTDATPPDPVYPVAVAARGETALVLWIAAELRAAGFIDPANIAVGRSPANLPAARGPTAWIYPIGFQERNDALDLSFRASSIGVHLSVDAGGSADDLASYQELEILAGHVTDRIETGPSWCNPSSGGLLAGRYETPPAQTQNRVTPMTPDLGLLLTFVYSWDRSKP